MQLFNPAIAINNL